MQEHNLPIPVSMNRGRSSEGKHNTDPVQKYCISGAYTADLATSTFGGSHQRTGTHGWRATAQKQSVWTHMHVPTCREYSRLAASVFWLPRWWAHGSTWLLSGSLKGLHSSLLVGSGFFPTSSTAPGGRGTSKAFSCHPWSLSAVASLRWLMFTQNSTAVLCGDVNCIVHLPESSSFILPVTHSTT